VWRHKLSKLERVLVKSGDKSREKDRKREI